MLSTLSLVVTMVGQCAGGSCGGGGGRSYYPRYYATASLPAGSGYSYEPVVTFQAHAVAPAAVYYAMPVYYATSRTDATPHATEPQGRPSSRVAIIPSGEIQAEPDPRG